MSQHPRASLALVIAVVAILAVLPACSGTAPAAPTAAPAPAAAAPTAAPAAPATTSAAPAATTAAAAPAAPTAAPAAAAPTAAAPAKVTEYNVVVITDNSGPGAETIKSADMGRKVSFAWWNDTVGKQLGIKLNAKFYDGRYDATQIATIYSTALPDKPIFVVGFGSADVAALQQRLPTDKVPMYIGLPSYGFAWLPNQWVFNTQAPATHYVTGFINWKLSTWKENRPLRIASIGNDQAPALKDVVTGVQSAFDKGLFAGKAEYVGVEWAPLTNPDMASAVKRLLDKKADYIKIDHPTTPQIGALRAIEQLKGTAKLILSSGVGVTAMVNAGVALSELEGHIEAIGLANETEDIEARRLFEQYKSAAGAAAAKYDAGSLWGWANVLPALRAVERAAKTAGADKVTGEAVYNAMYAGPISSKDMLGVTGDLTYSKDAPFPAKNAKGRIGTVTGGKYGLATPDWVAVPELQKW